MQFDEVLRTFGEWFEREGIRYAVADGLAVHAWGYSRATYDIDFVIDGANRARAMAFAESLGYRTTFASDGYSNHHRPDQRFGHVDFMYVHGKTAEQVFAEATRRVPAGEVEAPVPRPEHLMAMKVVAMKNSPMGVLGDSRDIEYSSGCRTLTASAFGNTLRTPDCHGSTMPSKETALDVDFARDVPTTAEDIAALERARRISTG